MMKDSVAYSVSCNLLTHRRVPQGTVTLGRKYIPESSHFAGCHAIEFVFVFLWERKRLLLFPERLQYENMDSPGSDDSQSNTYFYNVVSDSNTVYLYL